MPTWNERWGERRDRRLTVQRERLKNSQWGPVRSAEGPVARSCADASQTGVFFFLFPLLRLFVLFASSPFFSYPCEKLITCGLSLRYLSHGWVLFFPPPFFWSKVQKQDFERKHKNTEANKNNKVSSALENESKLNLNHHHWQRQASICSQWKVMWNILIVKCVRCIHADDICGTFLYTAESTDMEVRTCVFSVAVV